MKTIVVASVLMVAAATQARGFGTYVLCMAVGYVCAWLGGRKTAMASATARAEARASARASAHAAALTQVNIRLHSGADELPFAIDVQGTEPVYLEGEEPNVDQVPLLESMDTQLQRLTSPSPTCAAVRDHLNDAPSPPLSARRPEGADQASPGFPGGVPHSRSDSPSGDAPRGARGGGTGRVPGRRDDGPLAGCNREGYDGDHAWSPQDRAASTLHDGSAATG